MASYTQSMNLGKRQQRSGFTLIEVVVIVVVLVILGLLLLQVFERNRQAALRIACSANVKQNALGYLLWAQDSENGYLPFWTPYKEGGLKDPGTNRIQITGIGDFAPELRSNAWLQFLFIHEQLHNPRLLLCPADRERTPVNSWRETGNGLAAPGRQNNAISYCIGLDPRMKLNTHLGGSISGILLTERHMEYGTINSACSANVGLTKVVKVNRQNATNTLVNVGWKKRNPKLHKEGGNVARLDGSVHWTTSKQVQDLLAAQPSDNGELHFIYP